MKRIAWTMLAAGILIAAGASAGEVAKPRAGVHRCQQNNEPLTPHRTGGPPHGPPQPQGSLPGGPVGPNFNQGINIRRPRAFDRQAYQRNWNAPRRYHNGTYVRPQGWYYRRWTYGQLLPAIFWAQPYWIASWAAFGLMAPPYGYQWVRYGDDAILVDTSTGQILQVEYGVFY